MDARADAPGPAARRLIITGLGPGDLDRVPAATRALLEDPGRTVIVRTMEHPAAAQLAAVRTVETCDDLYAESDDFTSVYERICERVLVRAGTKPTVYAVPGSPLVGEFAVGLILDRLPDAEVIPAESFVDAILRAVGYDPFDRGLRIVNGHQLPEPLALDAPTIVGHLDAPAVLADVSAQLARVLPEGSSAVLCANVGSIDERVVRVPIDAVPSELAGFRTSLFVDTQPAGMFGLIGVSRRLRRECPWDREQTHSTLVAHLVEEVNELIEAISGLPSDDEVDFVAYDAVEEELGDVLLQVLFHAAIAAERGVFGIDDVATRLQEKLVRRHPHVFGDVRADTASEVADNWEEIKATEKRPASSLMDGIPEGISGLERAAKLQRRARRAGFDWEGAAGVVAQLRAETTELEQALESGGDVGSELGDILFTAVNLARHLQVSPEVALRQATARFERRFRAMEAAGPLTGLDLGALEARWEAAKSEVG